MNDHDWQQDIDNLKRHPSLYLISLKSDYVHEVLMMHDGYIVKEQILSKLDSHETKVIYLSQLLNGIGREHKWN